MRLALTGLVIAAALAAGAQSGRAQESFFNDRFCARGGGAESDAFPDCSFHTWEQCIASARSEGRWCTTNPGLDSSQPRQARAVVAIVRHDCSRLRSLNGRAGCPRRMLGMPIRRIRSHCCARTVGHPSGRTIIFCGYSSPLHCDASVNR